METPLRPAIAEWLPANALRITATHASTRNRDSRLNRRPFTPAGFRLDAR